MTNKKEVFKIGDCVILNTGGPDMVILSTSENKILCSWFDGTKVKEHGFIPIVLTAKSELR